jgi:hypothetical protein
MKTKIGISLVMLSLIFCVSVNAQEWGIRNGVTAATFAETGDLYDNNNTTLSYTCGVFRTFKLNERFKLLPEVNYARKGRTSYTKLPNITAQADYFVHYLLIPLQLQYVEQLNTGRSGTQIHFMAGPYMAFPFKDEVKNIHSDNILPLDEMLSNPKNDVGLTIGLGCEFPLYRNHFLIDLKYELGMREIANMPNDFRSKALNLTLGYAF